MCGSLNRPLLVQQFLVFFFFMSIILPYGDTIQIKPQSLYLDWWGRFKENKRIRH